MRDFNENTATDGVLKSFQTIKNQRLKELMGSIVSHLHMVVKETEPTIKGQTAANSSKPAILDNGLRIMVPQFIAEGEAIIVSTETCEYLERS